MNYNHFPLNNFFFSFVCIYFFSSLFRFTVPSSISHFFCARCDWISLSLFAYTYVYLVRAFVFIFLVGNIQQ